VTAAELQQACEEEFPSCDVLLMAAAVADFRPSAPRMDKIKKAGGRSESLELEPTADVLAGLAARRGDGQTIVGFAAEHGEGAVASAREKLADKRLDAIVVNDISRDDIGFDVEHNEVTIVLADGRAPGAATPTQGRDRAGADSVQVARAPKSRVAEAVLDAVERLRRGGHGDGLAKARNGGG
jgi:phosphopantothenoylcysteine decarboxylase / phosphopantothenate---cysteine ligase